MDVKPGSFFLPDFFRSLLASIHSRQTIWSDQFLPIFFCQNPQVVAPTASRGSKFSTAFSGSRKKPSSVRNKLLNAFLKIFQNFGAVARLFNGAKPWGTRMTFGRNSPNEQKMIKFQNISFPGYPFAILGCHFRGVGQEKKRALFPNL